MGGNGVGKTTLIEILMGMQDADTGAVHRPKDMTIGYLPQELDEELDGTVIEVTLEGAHAVNALAERLRSLETRLGDVNAPDYDKVLSDYGETQTHFEQLGGYARQQQHRGVDA